MAFICKSNFKSIVKLRSLFTSTPSLCIYKMLSPFLMLLLLKIFVKILTISVMQCLGPGFAGSVRFLLPGSGSTDLVPRGKIWTKNCTKQKIILLSKPKSELFEKGKNFLISEWFINF